MKIPNDKSDFFLFSYVPSTSTSAFERGALPFPGQKRQYSLPGVTHGNGGQGAGLGQNTCSFEMRLSSKWAVYLLSVPPPLTRASWKARTPLSGTFYYLVESKFAFSLEYKKATEKQRANPLQPSAGLHRGKANTIRMVCPPTAGARLLPESCVGG